MLNIVKSKKTIGAVLLASAISIGAFSMMNGAMAESQEDRIEAAKAYEKVVSVESMTKDMFDAMRGNPQVGLTDEDIDMILGLYDFDEMRKIMLEAMAKHFTVTEINALTEFYSKPEGVSVMKKFPAYMNDLMPYMQQMMMKGMQAAMQKRAEKAKAAAEEAEAKDGDKE